MPSVSNKNRSEWLERRIAKEKIIMAERKKAEREAAKEKRAAEKKAKHEREVFLRRIQRSKERRKITANVWVKKYIKKTDKEKKRQQTLKRKRAQHRYYVKHHRSPRIRHRLRKGDELGYYILFFTRNKKQGKTINRFWWKNSGLEAMDEMVKKNHEEVICPVCYERRGRWKKLNPVQYEIILKKKIDPERESNIRDFRDDMGIAVSVETSNPGWLIIAKEDWYIEEKFYVFGQDKRKDAKWIIKNMIKQKTKEYGFCRIYVFGCYLILEDYNDFNFVITKNDEESVRLYNILERILSEEEGVLFTGSVAERHTDEFVERIMDKTGWSEENVIEPPPLYR